MNVFQHRQIEHPTSANSRRSRLASYAVRLSAVCGLIAVAMPISPVTAAQDSRNDFKNCTSDLGKLQISQEEAVSACSRALYPENLYKCVTKVSGNGYSPADALNACRQVREPENLASCVVDIRRHVSSSVAADVLDSCRRSLLPTRYANCVIGVSRGDSGLAPEVALSSCNDSLYFPREVDPTFIPYSQTEPAQVFPGQSIQTTPASPGIFTPTTPAPSTPAPSTPAPSAPSQSPVRGLF